MNLIHNMCPEITLQELLSHLPGANKLTHLSQDKMAAI